MLFLYFKYFILDIFKYDPDFEKEEAEYEEIRKEIIGDADDSEAEEAEEGEEGEDEGEKPAESMSWIVFYIF